MDKASRRLPLMPGVGMKPILPLLLLLSVGSTVYQPTAYDQPSYQVDVGYSQPALLGHSMFLKVNVTNLAWDVVANVENVTVRFDWNTILTGQAPELLRPGERKAWGFDVSIPSYTWNGLHACEVSIAVLFSTRPGAFYTRLGHGTSEAYGKIPLEFAAKTPPYSAVPTIVAGPSLTVFPVATTSSTNLPDTSASSFAYRCIMIASVAIAVIFLVMRQRGQIYRPEQRRLPYIESPGEH